MYRKEFQDKSQRTYMNEAFMLNLQSNLVFSRGTVILTFNLQNYLIHDEPIYFDVLVVRYFILMIITSSYFIL